MIKYNIICKECNLNFDSWFASSKEFEKLKSKKLLNCHNCNSLNVEKNLMAPKLIRNKPDNDSNQELKKHLAIKNKIKEYQKFIQKNFDYVGNNFSHKARALHYSDKKKLKGIYGKASSEEISDLKNEGIETEVIPWFNDKEN